MDDARAQALHDVLARLKPRGRTVRWARAPPARARRRAAARTGPEHHRTSTSRASPQRARAVPGLESLGLEVVFADKSRGRIEATDTTFWFGFKDDVAIRIRAEGAGSVVDIRSVSRVGQSDLGKNAERIGQILDVLGPG